MISPDVKAPEPEVTKLPAPAVKPKIAPTVQAPSQVPVQAAVRRLVSAGSSTNPDVQHLIADMAAAYLNGNSAVVAAINERLAKLGYYA